MDKMLLVDKAFMRIRDYLNKRYPVKVEPRPDIPFVPGTDTDNIVQLGTQAKDMLNNAVFMRAVKDIEAIYTGMWNKSKPDQAEGRELLWNRIQALHTIRLKIQGYVNVMLFEQDKKKEEESLEEMMAASKKEK